MSNKRLTVWIDGREALPVRAIPYVSGWDFSSDRIVKIFAGEHPFISLGEITPHRLTSFDASNPIYAPTAPRDWENIGIKMARQIMAVFEKYEQRGLPKEVGNFGSEDYLPPKDLTQETHCSARRDELREVTGQCLPASVFVWLEEFNRVYFSLGYKFPDHKLVLDPILEAEAVSWVMEGFSDYDLPVEASNTPAPLRAVDPPKKVGISKHDIAHAFDELHFSEAQWLNALSKNIPDWLMSCRLTLGRKGSHKNAATWNPVLIACALYDKAGEGVDIKKLDAVFNRKLKGFKSEWEEVSASFR